MGQPRSAHISQAVIADPDPDFLDTLKQEVGTSTFNLLMCQEGREAQLLLADKSVTLQAILVNPAVQNPGGISVIRAAHLHRPAIPIYLIHDGPESGFSEADLKNLCIQKVVKKPVTIEEIIKLSAPQALIFDQNTLLEISKQNTDQLGAESAYAGQDFVPILASNFMAGSKSFFDIYVRLGSGKLIKILQAGDHFQLDRVQSYMKKGVVHFYIKKEAQAGYLAYCDKLANVIIEHPTISAGLKITQTLNFGEETMSMLRSQGISDATVSHSMQFVQSVRRLIKKLDMEEHPPFNAFLANFAAFEHGVATTMVTAIIVQEMKILSDKPVGLFGMAAMFHDISLYGMPEEVREEDESAMSPANLELYRTHPKKSAEILLRVKGVDSVVIQAIEQHHQRRDRTGFPQRSGGALGTVSEVIGMTDEFVRLLKRAKEEPGLNVMDEMQTNVLPAFSHPVAQKFADVFLGGKLKKTP